MDDGPDRPQQEMGIETRAELRTRLADSGADVEHSQRALEGQR